ncbi:hypothetical protein ACODTP_11820 [Acinetobacter pittii]|uniref:hypothetical protein n=1 Tax=Acinetobacter pittii TaxID=48296 RepID=UPI003B42D7B6
MLKILALAVIGSSIVYYAFNELSKPEKKSKTAILISQAEESIAIAHTTMKNADNSLSKVQAKQ